MRKRRTSPRLFRHTGKVNNASQTTPHTIEPLHKIHIICFSAFLYVAVLARKTLDSLPLFAPLLTNPAELMKRLAPPRRSRGLLRPGRLDAVPRRYTAGRLSMCTAVVYQRSRLSAVPHVHAGPPAADLGADRPARVIGVQRVIRETPLDCFLLE